MPTNLTPEIINAAILGFEEQKRHIDVQIAELRSMLDGGSTKPTPAAMPEAPTATPEATTGKRKISVAARRRMALGQQARWAKIRGESEPPAPATAEAPKPKRKLSKEGRANIVAALKKRHAAAKKAGTSATAKDTAPARKKSATKKAVTKGSRTKAATKAPAAALSTQAAG
jgi:hypothetical protein